MRILYRRDFVQPWLKKERRSTNVNGARYCFDLINSIIISHAGFEMSSFPLSDKLNNNYIDLELRIDCVAVGN